MLYVSLHVSPELHCVKFPLQSTANNTPAEFGKHAAWHAVELVFPEEGLDVHWDPFKFLVVCTMPLATTLVVLYVSWQACPELHCCGFPLQLTANNTPAEFVRHAAWQLLVFVVVIPLVFVLLLFTQLPFEQVWFELQVVCSCGFVALEQYELDVPGLLQVYVK